MYRSMGCNHPGVTSTSQVVLGLHLPECLVVALGKTVVAVQQHTTHLGHLALQPVHRIIGAGVVSHNDLGLGRRIHYATQKTLHHGHAIPVEYYYSYFFHLRVLFLL